MSYINIIKLLSSRIDSLRHPYGRAIEDFPRTLVFGGSTNRQEFLHDLAEASPSHRWGNTDMPAKH